jgi:hypothetical protein
MFFSVREDDGTDFSTLSGKTAFRWNRLSATLGEVSREGAWTFGPSSGLTSAHLLQNSSTSGSGVATLRLQNNSTNGTWLDYNEGGNIYATGLSNGSSTYLWRAGGTGGTVTGQVTSAGTWRLGPSVTGNANGQRHIINGSLNAGNVTSAEQSGAFFINSNVRISSPNAIDGRINSVVGGGAIYFETRTGSNARAISFYTNLPGDSTTTNGTRKGFVTTEGAWTLGPSTGSPGHKINGNNALPGTSGSADDRILRLSPTGTNLV